MRIKKGDIVGRKSYGKDILFKINNIVKRTDEDVAILDGITKRIEADSKISDLEKISKREIKEKLKEINENIKKKIYSKINKRYTNEMKPGKILHLDGDKRYSEKSYYYYQKMGLDAIVRNIPEYKQPKVVKHLLGIYKPDILVITGHDGMLRRGSRYYDIYNYRNSRYFIETVKQAREFDKEEGNNLVIFAGACQSYFEALISAGANFASSPARILIDFLDPLIVAQKIATTEKYKYITIDDIAYELRDGKNGVSGIGAKGKLSKR